MFDDLTALRLIPLPECPPEGSTLGCHDGLTVRTPVPPAASSLAGGKVLTVPSGPLPEFPRPGEQFGGFDLLAELGSGAFAKVYLARDADLAGRPVALKVTAASEDDGDTLARLQHEHIVPAYARQRVGRHVAVVMPYFGAANLAHVLAERRDRSWGAAWRAARDRRRERLPAAALGDCPAPAPGTDSVAVFLARLAAGLAHAHARKVAHRDLKPANVLVADDGRPMILDFNLSGPSGGGSGFSGGTPPYMAPEQLLLFADLPGGAADSRSDVYAFGLVMREILGGSSQPRGTDVEAQLDDRRRLAGLPPEADPGLAAILAKCLQFKPAERYADAGPLAEDLALHAAGFPLRHAANPPGDRLRKWVRRNRHSVSAGGLAVAACLVAALLAVFWIVAAGRAAADRTRLEVAAFLDDAPRAAGELAALPPGEAGFDAALADVDRLLARFPGGGTPAERRRLADPTRQHLDRTLQLLECVAAHARRTRDGDAADPVAPSTPREAPEAAGEADADELTKRAVAAMAERRYDVAASLLERVVAGDARQYPAWVMLATCRAGLGDEIRAERACTAALAIHPASARVLAMRGLNRIKLSRIDGALEDFKKVIHLAPDDAEARYSLARCLEQTSGLEAAEAAYTQLLEHDPNDVRVWWRRAGVRDRRKDAAGAKSDREAALSIPPKRYSDWITRAHLRRDDDPKAALADCEDLLKRLPMDPVATHFKVWLLADRDAGPAGESGRLARATLDAYLARYPRDAKLLATRAALLAREGDAEGTVADCRSALGICPESKAVKYQVGGALARLSGHKAAYKPAAMKYLREAWRAGYGIPDPEKPLDPDLVPIGSDPDFKATWEAAQKLYRQEGSAKPPEEKP